MTPLERQFHNAMVEIYRRALEECRYRATIFLRMLNEHGGWETAKRLLGSEEVQYGYTELWLCGRLDLTVEAHVRKTEYRPLFTNEEIRRAEARLAAHGYQFSEE